MEKDWGIYDNGVEGGDNLHTGTAGLSFPSEAGEISSPPSSTAGIGLNCIQHRVSKFDTLAGVAIRYGVEVGMSYPQFVCSPRIWLSLHV